MPTEQIRFWLETLGTIAGLIGVFAIVWELQRARRADAREFLFHTYEKFTGMHAHRVIVDNLEINSYEDFIKVTFDEKTQESVIQIYNFWDLLTRTVRDKSVDPKIAVEHFGRVFMTYYEKTAQYHHQYRRLEGGSRWFESFDWFADQYLTLMPGDWQSFQMGLESTQEVLSQINR